MKELLERFTKAVEAMSETAAPPAAAEPPAPEAKTMTPEEFMAYATSEVEKAAKDPAEVRKARLAHLKTNLATVAKNFEGPTPGAMAIPVFKDPGQQTTTTTEKAVPTATGQGEASNFSQNDTPPAVNQAGNTPPGGTMPAPNSAGSSGFETPANATFAKAVEAMAKAVATIETATASKPAEPPAPVAKAEGVQWAADMNTPFGRGEKDAPTEPDWGWDSKKEPAASAS